MYTRCTPFGPIYPGLAVEETAALELGLAAHVDAQLAQHRLVRRRDDHAKEGIAATQLLQARKDAGRRLARC